MAKFRPRKNQRHYSHSFGIVHSSRLSLISIALLLPWLPVHFASVLVSHFDLQLIKRGRLFEVPARIIGVVAAFRFKEPTKDVKVFFSPLRTIVSEFVSVTLQDDFS